MVLVDVLIALASVGVLYGASGMRVVKQYERGLVFRFGRVLSAAREPGLAFIVPAVDRMRKVNMQIVTLPVPAQDGITRDNVTVRVDAVVYFKVIDPVRAVINVQDYRFAVLQVAQTSLRSIIGKSELDDLLSNREQLNQGLELMIDSPALDWGIHIDRVEIKDVALPEAMKRSMSRQAEAERERRARVIAADGELQASSKLAQAAARMSESPSALQLRLLETVVEVAAEKNSTLVLPFPVELLRFLERSTGAPGGAGSDAASGASTGTPAVASGGTSTGTPGGATTGTSGGATTGNGTAPATPAAQAAPEPPPLPAPAAAPELETARSDTAGSDTAGSAAAEPETPAIKEFGSAANTDDDEK